MRIIQKTWNSIWEHRLLAAWSIVISILVVVVVLKGSYVLISANSKFILSKEKISEQNITTGLILGAGVAKNGKPYKELQARLDSAADNLSKGSVKKLILSGDNRVKKYNEPAAMQKYLIEQRHVAQDKLVMDYAGRSTYESCERAAKVFGQKKLIIFSAESHLPRAIYLCRHFGIESFGVPSGIEANNSTRREILARTKAIINVYFHGEKTVLGPPIVM